MKIIAFFARNFIYGKDIRLKSQHKMNSKKLYLIR